MTDDQTLDREVDRDMVRAMSSQTVRSSIVAALAGVPFLWGFGESAPVATWSWYGTLCLVQLVNLFYQRHFRRSTSVESTATWDPAPWRRLSLIMALVNGAVFGAAGWLFADPVFQNLVWFTVIVICGTAAASMHIYAYHPKAMLCFLFALTLPLWIRLWTFGIPLGLVSGGLFTVYVSTVVLLGMQQARLMRGSVRMRYENLSLVARLRERTQALAASNLAKSHFFAAASHDLRQPVHALSYYVSLLKPNTHDQPHVERIEQCVGTLDNLLEGVLDIARLDAGRVRPHRRSIDLSGHVRRLANLYGGAATAKKLELRIRVPKKLAAGDTDEQLLERVLANFINNAVRYTRTGGVLLAVRSRGSDWGIAVIDTGVGIGDEHLQSVFNEFVQVGNQERNTSKGVGLGLATVKRICALLAHPIVVRSKVASGSWFEVRVPRADPATVPSDAPADEHATELRGRVLLVEDNELVSESLAKVLESWGLECDIATDGNRALHLAGANRYDAALCDWRLPGDMNGCETLRHLARLQPNLKLRVLLTGESDDSIVDLPEGVPLLRKPIRPIRLRALLSAYLLAPTV